MNGPPITMSLILPFHKTVEEDDEKPSSKQIGDLPAHYHFVSKMSSLETQNITTLHKTGQKKY